VGLTGAQAHERLQRWGRNAVPPQPARPLWRTVLAEVHEPQQRLLLCVAVAYALVGEVEEAALALAVIGLIVLVEVLTEQRAKAAVSRLQGSVPQDAAVMRDGQECSVPLDEVAVGDVVLLRPGVIVPADARVLQAHGLRVQEAALTGEPVHVAKSAQEEAGAEDSTCVVHATTTIVAGCGRAVVVATGVGTTVGRTIATARRAKPPPTRLQQELKRLAGVLVWVAVAASVVGAALGFVRSRQWQDVVLTALALAFATIPEELPLLIAAVLAVGARALATRSGVYVKRLAAMEALPHVGVLITDKTGTLTTARLQVREFVVAGASGEVHTFAPGTLPPPTASLWAAWARMAIQPGSVTTRDPFVAAVHAAVSAGGGEHEAVVLRALADVRIVADEPFDATTKLAVRSTRESNGTIARTCAGAPECVLERCGHVRDATTGLVRLLDTACRGAMEAAILELAVAGRRMVAYATLQAADPPSDAVRDGVWEGMIAFEDPIRSDAAHMVAQCQRAGVRVVMITGDHPAAAAAVARTVGIQSGTMPAPQAAEPLRPGATASVPLLPAQDERDGGPSVIARATPADKAAAVRRWQAAGHTVAVTGDGVNDSVALATADVGVAVQAAVPAAREAASVVLTRDSLSGFLSALAEGRRLADNLTHAIAFYLSAKAGLLVAYAVTTPWLGFPLAPVQVLVLEAFMDLGATTAFVAEPMEAGVLHRPPVTGTLLGGALVLRVALGGASMAAAVLSCFVWVAARESTAGDPLSRARSMAFVAWLIGHVALAWNQRTCTEPVLGRKPACTVAFAVWALVAAALAVACAFAQPLAASLALTPLPAPDWAAAVGSGLACTCWLEAAKWAHRACRFTRVT
jgi:P-type Ca2+ transporter type 2C